MNDKNRNDQMGDKLNAPCNPITTGIIPQCGMLAVSYVPVQRNTDESYEPEKALARGTLFPGLDLPYRGMINQTDKTPSPLEELMAVGFAVHELGLYLDTHPDDEDAAMLFNKYNKMYGEGTAEYERRYGPLQMTSSNGVGFDWVDSPWPWEKEQPKPNPQMMPRKKED